MLPYIYMSMMQLWCWEVGGRRSYDILVYKICPFLAFKVVLFFSLFFSRL